METILDNWPFPTDPRPNQIAALNWMAEQEAKYIMLEAPVGCHLAGTPILMFDGAIKPIEQINVNDLLMGPDSSPRKIKCLHSGREQMYTIIPTKGEAFVVNEHHILSLKTTKARRSGFDGNTIINISVKDYLLQSNDFKNNIKLYRSTGVVFNNKTKLPIDPYFLGVLLGDGTIHTGQVGVTTADPEILNEIYHQANKFKLQITTNGKHLTAPTYYINTGKRGGRPENCLMETLKEIGVYGTKSGDKFIPHLYKTSNKQSRLQILAGLIDTDGYYNRIFSHTTKSFQLHNDIKFIARSLGFSANTYVRIIEGVEYYDAHISGQLDQIPTKIKRKQAAKRKQKKRVNVTSFDVVKYGIDSYYGFEVDQDNLFLMGDFTVTHNSGKSYVGLTYARFLHGKSFILTPQKILQEQYSLTNPQITDGRQIASLYGKANYSCQFKKTNCDIGGLVKPRCYDCPYATAKETAQKAFDTVLNYKLALTSFSYTDAFDKRKLMVCDECHTLEQHLVDFDALQIKEWQCKKYKIKFEQIKDIEQALDWLGKVYVPQMKNVVGALEEECEYLYDNEGNSLTPKELRKLRELKSLLDHHDEALEMSIRTPSYVKEKFVLSWGKETFEFKRVTGAHTFHKTVKPYADRFLFMSSTILNREGFCQDLGIPEEDAAFLSLESEFDKDNRKIIYMPQMKMNAKWNNPENKSDRRKMLRSVEKLIDIHKDEKGIIHTSNFKIAQWLVDQLNVSHKIYHHNPDADDSRDAVINGFIGDPSPSILISPSSTEGLDLKDDLARFAMFVKIGFPYLGDQWIKKRMDLSREWYLRRTVIDTIQGSGRIVRSKDDSGTVYILDGSFGFLRQQTYYMMPKWWRSSIETL